MCDLGLIFVFQIKELLDLDFFLLGQKVINFQRESVLFPVGGSSFFVLLFVFQIKELLDHTIRLDEFDDCNDKLRSAEEAIRWKEEQCKISK